MFSGLLIEPVQNLLLGDRLGLAASEGRKHPLQLQSSVVGMVGIPRRFEELVCIIDELAKSDVLSVGLLSVGLGNSRCVAPTLFNSTFLERLSRGAQGPDALAVQFSVCADISDPVDL